MLVVMLVGMSATSMQASSKLAAVNPVAEIDVLINTALREANENIARCHRHLNPEHSWQLPVSIRDKENELAMWEKTRAAIEKKIVSLQKTVHDNNQTTVHDNKSFTQSVYKTCFSTWQRIGITSVISAAAVYGAYKLWHRTEESEPAQAA